MIKIVRSLGTTYSGIHNVLLMECIQNKQYFARAMIPTVHFFFVLFIRAHSRMILYMKLFAWDNQIPRCWRIFCMRSVWCGYYMCVLTLDSVPGAAIDGADYSSWIITSPWFGVCRWARMRLLSPHGSARVSRIGILFIIIYFFVCSFVVFSLFPFCI